MAERKSFLIYKSWAPLVEAMSDEQAGMLFKAVFEYQLTREEPAKDAQFYPMFNLFKATFDQDFAAYQETCATNKRIAENRERKKTERNEPSRSVTNRHQSLRLATDNDNDNDNDNDKDKDLDKDICRVRKSAFTPPTVPEVQDYCRERHNNVDAQRFVDFYSSKGWMVGRSKMKDWRASVRTWEKNNRQNNTYQSELEAWANA